MDTQKIHTEFFVYGRVQGVYYRKTIQSKAHKLKITGFIENYVDGTVHIVAQGSDKNIQTFIKQCKTGSLISHVKKIIITETTPIKNPLKGFNIKKKNTFLKDQLSSFSHLIKNIMNSGKNDKIIENIPKHIVLIPNGNRTWAKERGLRAWKGYWETYKNLGEITREAEKLGISHITFWGFSTENWKRDSEEIDEVFKVVSLLIKDLGNVLVKKKIRFNHFGRKDRLPKKLVQAMERLEEITKEFSERSINIALDYGGRDEIVRAINTILKSGKNKITESEFSQYLDTKNVPDPDLIIRTSNEKRLSGMMPWQATYAEYYFADVYFPEFKAEQLRNAVIDFSKRKRTFGGNINKNKKPI